MVEYIIRTDKPERLNELLHLHEIPHYEVMRMKQHGRLIDADELYRIVGSMDKCSMSKVLEHILDAPTVLEATNDLEQ